MTGSLLAVSYAMNAVAGWKNANRAEGEARESHFPGYIIIASFSIRPVSLPIWFPSCSSSRKKHHVKHVSKRDQRIAHVLIKAYERDRNTLKNHYTMNVKIGLDEIRKKICNTWQGCNYPAVNKRH